MEYRIGLIPRALRSVEKGSPQTFRHAALTEMLRERAEAERAEALRAQPAPPPEIPPPESAARAAPVLPVENLPRAQIELRRSVMRHLTQFTKPWRACPMRTCRRHLRCASSSFACASPPPPPRSAKKEQSALAFLQRELKRRLARAEPK